MVRLVGVADLVLRIPGEGRWCVVELKLGRGSPQADLMQACLYHQMLSAESADGSSSRGTLAIVSFRPACEEQLIAAERVECIRAELLNLIGRLAGVLPTVPTEIAGVEQEPRAEPAVSADVTSVPPRRQPMKPLPEHIELGRRLVNTYREYGVLIETEGDPVVGPTFLRFPIRVGRGVRINKVCSLAPEVRMRLDLMADPFVHQPDGPVVIDVQRPDRQTVLFSNIRDQLPRADAAGCCSKVILGVDLNGVLRCADLADPADCHLLVAGTTGSGKSEWLRSATAGLLLTNAPETLRLVLIDPKRNAFSELKDSPFLFDEDSLVYPDERSAVGLLERLADEMDARYAMFEGADHLAEYIHRTGRRLPRIVCICDEYFDLISRGRQERMALEGAITRLGSKARAAGIHLILATQQPSRQVITGVLDANIPARVGFKTSKPIESRMLLGSSGAENLLGKGDLLFKDVGEPMRLQAPYLPPDERSGIFSSRSAL
jgi:DNA segregation ATPase FtsK/SpoIIIE, S-DNA-T family